jgi:hypothetical protein
MIGKLFARLRNFDGASASAAIAQTSVSPSAAKHPPATLLGGFSGRFGGYG